MNSSLSILYVPCSNDDEAKSIGQQLISKRLAACVQILPIMTSIYEWKGDITEAKEQALIVKTTHDKQDECRVEIARLHSYEVPCILSISADSLNKAFSLWVASQTH